MKEYVGPWVRIRFLKAWGHPTKWLIMGRGDIAKVSPSIADQLVKSGYAELHKESKQEVKRNK